jgi:hypothetical protein
MATSKDLDAGLEQLRNDAKEQNKLFVSSKIALYKALVDTYLWWRDASQKDGYLEKRFADANIKFKTKLNRPNFNPIVRLVMGMQQHLQNVQISNWGSAINAIDDEYQRNGHIYRNRDTSAELVDWIDDNGGISGICGKKKEEIEEYGYDYKDAGKKKKKTNKNTEQKQKQQLEVLELKKVAIAQNETAETFDVGEVGTGDDDLVVVLAKATGNGNQLRVVGSTAQQTLVDNAIMQIGEVDFANAPASLRMLCEAIKLNTIPKTLQKYGARKNFYNQSKVKILNDKGKEQKLLENTRLVLQRNGTILVSKSTSDASLVTYYIPSKKFLLNEDIWLRGSDRYWLETELINESEIALYDATDLEKQKSKQIKATNQVTLKNTLTKQSRNIYFYDFSRIDDATMYQPSLVADEIKYDWEVKGNASYFRRLYEHHFEGWQHRVKHRLHTANNKAVAFEVSEDGITCEKKWDKAELCFTQTGARYLTAFGDDVEANGTGRIVFAPTDIIAVLDMISKHKVKNNSITMMGNKDLLYVNFSNDVAEIQVYIPSCSITGKRNAKYFTKFVAND